ncbi:MAG: right-handed parallel beta-helix repeat-containing protein [Candidatus Cybelea sp.]
MSLSTPGVFNVLDDWYMGTGMVAGLTSAAVNNALVLQAIIYAAQNADASGCLNGPKLGATILFPGNDDVPPPVGPGPYPDDGAEYFIAVPSAMTTPFAVQVNCNWPLRFLGTGNVRLTMFDGGFGYGDMFSIDTGGGDNAGGITFEDLSLHYPTIDESESIPQYTAIHVPGTGNVRNLRIVRCVFWDCPIAVWLENCLQGSILQSTIYYHSNTGTGIWLGNGMNIGDSGLAKQIYVAGCLISNDSAHGAPPGGTGILIMGADQVRIVDSDVGGFSTAIAITPGPYGQNAVHVSFTNLGIYPGPALDSTLAGTAVLIQPQSTGVVIGSITFTNCRFDPGESNSVGTTGAGVTVDNNGSMIDTVRFVSCISTRWSGPGLLIQFTPSEESPKLQNVEVLGGMYAGNNLAYIEGALAYGILVTGGAVNGVRIVGASCVGEYRDITNHDSSDSPIQDIGIYVDSGASDIIIDGCDLRKNSDYGIVVNAASDVVISGCDLSNNGIQGVLVNEGASDVIIDACDVTNNGTNGIKVVATSGAVTGVYIRDCNASGYSSYNVAIYVDATGTYASTVEITNCAGYNDQGKVFTPAIVSGTTFYPYAFGYWGPIECYIANGSGSTISSITVDGTVIPPKSGSVLLVPGESASIAWTPTILPIGFVVIGK